MPRPARRLLVGVLVAFSLTAAAPAAQASVVCYEFTLANGWFQGCL